MPVVDVKTDLDALSLTIVAEFAVTVVGGAITNTGAVVSVDV